jgi:hypothetical protein
VRAGGVRRREAGDIDACRIHRPEQGGLDLAGVVAAAFAVVVEAGLVGLPIGQAIEAGADVGLDELVRKYIQNQEKEDERLDQLDLEFPEAPEMGSHILSPWLCRGDLNNMS